MIAVMPESRPDHRRLLRRILRIEGRLRSYRPRPIPAPDPPPQAEEVLAAVAARYGPGDRVSIRDAAEAAGVTRAVAGFVRAWANHPAVGRWPYLKGAINPADWSGSGRGLDLEDIDAGGDP